MRKRSGRPPRFAAIPNQTIDDAASLDFMALGLLAVLLRHQDGWEITLAEIGEKYGYGREALANAMGALQVARYVIKIRSMAVETNQWSTEVYVYDTPATDEEAAAVLAAVEADPGVRRAEIIQPTATATARADKRRAKLGAPKPRSGASVAVPPRVPENPHSGLTCENDEKPQVAPECRVSRLSGDPAVSKKTVEKKTKKTDGGGDGRRPSAGGFARAGVRGPAGAQGPGLQGGSAADRKKPPRPRTPQKITDARPVPGEDEVWAEIDALGISRRGSRPPTLHKAVRLLLGHNTDARSHPFADCPRRPEHALMRINRGWYRARGPERSAPEYRGCSRCTATGCTAPREDCDRILRPVGYLADLLERQYCHVPDCELGVILGSGAECEACGQKAAERAGARLAERLERDTPAPAAEGA